MISIFSATASCASNTNLQSFPAACPFGYGIQTLVFQRVGHNGPRIPAEVAAPFHNPRTQGVGCQCKLVKDSRGPEIVNEIEPVGRRRLRRRYEYSSAVISSSKGSTACSRTVRRRSTITSGAVPSTAAPSADRIRKASLNDLASQWALLPPDNWWIAAPHSSCQASEWLQCSTCWWGSVPSVSRSWRAGGGLVRQGE